MPPLCSAKPCLQYIGRRSRVRSRVTRPTLLIGEALDNEDEDANDSDENISPDAERSEIRFTLGRKQSKGNKYDTRNDDESDGDRRGGNRNSDDNPNSQDSLKFNRFHDNNDEGGGGFFGFGGDRNRGGGDNNNSNEIGFHRGGGRGRGRPDKNSGNTSNDGNSTGNTSSATDGGGSKPGLDNNSSTLLPSPLASTTSGIPGVEASTTTSVEESTVVPAAETTITSAAQNTALPLSTSVSALANSSPTALPAQVTPTTSAVPTNLEPALSTGSQATTSVSAPAIPDSRTPVPTSTSTANNRNNGPFGKCHHGCFGKFGNKSNGNKGKGLNLASERILIAVGAVGAFIVFCFIAWMVYRTLKKSKKSGGSGSSKNWLSKWIPLRGRSATRAAQTTESTKDPKEPSPTYDVGNFNSMQASGYYGLEKADLTGLEGTTFPSTTDSQGDRALWQGQGGQQPSANSRNQYPQSNDQIMDSSGINSTLRSRMPDPYFNQSELAREPSHAYNPAQRQVYRASEISSLSSGFGDGDIIMPPPATIPKLPTAQAQVPNTDTNNRRFSWMNRSGGNEQQGRDTVYTTTSESPTRSRSITSWVEQQKTRIKRADSKARTRGEVPRVPTIPGQFHVTQQTAER